jgi:hypothetical protein
MGIQLTTEGAIEQANEAGQANTNQVVPFALLTDSCSARHALVNATGAILHILLESKGCLMCRQLSAISYSCIALQANIEDCGCSPLLNLLKTIAISHDSRELLLCCMPLTGSQESPVTFTA